MEPTCWICLDDAGDLHTVCGCANRRVHMECISRWQLQQSGQVEEHQCRFCFESLPDWRDVMMPKNSEPKSCKLKIEFEGKRYYIEIQPGEPKEQVVARMAQLVGININLCSMSFEIGLPLSNEKKVTLHGMCAMEDALRLACARAGQKNVRSTTT